MEKDFQVRLVSHVNEVPNALMNNAATEEDRAVKKITVPALLPVATLDPNSFLKRRALTLCDEALEVQRNGDLQKALLIYRSSIKVAPTAEAHCYMGWALSQLGRFDLAIQECHRAIRLDPKFGNSYNDIGSYLVRKGQWGEAIHWFERAKKIESYESPHFPYINLGRLYQSRGNLFRALREFKAVIKIIPFDKGIKEAIEKIETELKSGLPHGI